MNLFFCMTGLRLTSAGKPGSNTYLGILVLGD